MSVIGSIKEAFANGWSTRDRITNLNLGSSRTLYSPLIKNQADDYSNSIRSISKYAEDYPIPDSGLNSDLLPTQSRPANEYQLTFTNRYDKVGGAAENNFKIPASVISEISKYYKFVYSREADSVLDYGLPEKVDGKSQAETTKTDNSDVKLSTEVLHLPVVPSLFNPFYGINVVGIRQNTPLIDNYKATGDITVEFDDSKDENSSKKTRQITSDYNRYLGEDLSDCSIKKLVELSNAGKIGRGVYKYTDFMYCKDLGKYSNNRLITLRRFPLPVGDDIWSLGSPSSEDRGTHVELPLDTGRLITWLNETNKIEDILRYEYKDSFEERTGQMMETSSQEDQEDRGLVGSIVNLANPSYRKMVGTGFAGRGNILLNQFAGLTNNKIFSASSTNQQSNVLTMYDHNKIYTPPGTVRDTHLYNGQLTFSQNFSLTFEYELRAYENINPRTALLDLLNNIHQVTYRAGKFWGGQVWLAGAPGNTQGWRNANAMIDGTFEKVSDTFDSLLRGTLNIGDFFGSISNKFSSFASGMMKSVSEGMKNPSAIGSKIADLASKFDVGGMLKGMLKNNLGRPAIYTTDSILSGDPVGLWHVTIGNPRNPIMSMGNMIIDGSTLQHYGPLGIDDFPTGLRVTVNLKHGRSRDMIEIGKMYTMGVSGLGIPLGRTPMSEMYNGWSKNLSVNIDQLMFSSSFAQPVPQLSNGVRNKKGKGVSETPGTTSGQ